MSLCNIYHISKVSRPQKALLPLELLASDRRNISLCWLQVNEGHLLLEFTQSGSCGLWYYDQCDSSGEPKENFLLMFITSHLRRILVRE